MAIWVQLTLKCNKCEESCVASAPLVGKRLERLRVDMSEATVPQGWWVGMRTAGYGDGPEVACGCPEHKASLRDF